MTTPQGPSLAATGVLARYSDLARRNGAQSASYASAVVTAARTGVIPVSAVAGYLREVIGAAAATAVLLADLAVSADLTRRTGRNVPPLQLELPDRFVGSVRLAVDTVLQDVDWDDEDGITELTTRVERLGNALPLDVGQATQQEALKAHGVELFVRTTDGQACELCQSLADGKVVSIDRRFISHPNCACQMTPVLDPNVKAGDTLTATPADVHDGPQRTLSVGHGLYREEISTWAPGLTVRRSAPRTSASIDRYNPALNGATAAAARANRGRVVRTPLAPVYDLNEFRRKRNG